MHDHDESGVEIVRQAFEKHLQGVDASGRCSDADRGKPFCRWLTPVSVSPTWSIRRSDFF